MVETEASKSKRPWFAYYEAGVPHTQTYPTSSVLDLLIETAKRYPERTAIIFRRRRITYAELLERVQRMAGALRELGVEKGDRVSVMMTNCPQFTIAFFGVLHAGGIVVPISPLYTAREAEAQMKNAGVCVAIGLRRYAGVLSEAADGAGLRHVIITPQWQYAPVPDRWFYNLLSKNKKQPVASLAGDKRFHRWERLVDKAEPVAEPVPVSSDDLAVLQYTGGTTGVPKGAMLTHGNLVANCMQIVTWVSRKEDQKDVFLGVTPFFHIYGLTAVMLSAVALGAAVIHVVRFDVKRVVRAIRKHRPTMFHGVPTMYVAINAAAEESSCDFSSIETCLSASAPLPAEVQNRFEKLTGGRLVEAYGLTETSPATHINPLGSNCRSGSIGLPISDTDCRIVDPDAPDRDLPVGQPGELLIRGPQVMQGYWQAPEETANVLKDGWLHTGDISRMDEDGFFYIVDRKKDMIIAGGFNVYPREVEEVLLEHPSIQEAVVVGMPDPYRGETVKAFVVPRKGAKVDEAELRAFARERLAPYKTFKLLEIRDSIPKSAVGKALRRLLREGG
jgi:long-chain acyl-CoA synthetase